MSAKGRKNFFCFHEKQINFVMKVDLDAIPLTILIFRACLYTLIDNIYIYYLHKHMGIRAVIGRDVTRLRSISRFIHYESIKLAQHHLS